MVVVVRDRRGGRHGFAVGGVCVCVCVNTSFGAAMGPRGMPSKP